jgi:acyl dehydratase
MKGQMSEAFKRRLREAFDDVELGQEFSFRRTFTEADVTVFCGVTGDFNPYHSDDVFAHESAFGRRIIPGLLTAAMMTHIGGLIGFLATEMHFQFIAPVYIGDTITCTVKFVEKDAATRRLVGATRCVNQDGVEVLSARFSGFPSQVRLAR